jgi:hypothetical protein
MREGGTGLGAAMAGGNPEEGRQEGEFYPTPVEATRALCKQYAEVLKDRTVWEPCAGDGAMMDEIARYCRKVVGTDIVPRRGDVRQLDMLNSVWPAIPIVITNPPFNIAEDIIRHALHDKPPQFFALLLKATYWHARTRVGLFQNYRPYAVHPLTWRPDFLGRGAPTMDVMWCVWRHTPYGQPVREYTDYQPLNRPNT